jgi:hypothetical protein
MLIKTTLLCATSVMTDTLQLRQQGSSLLPQQGHGSLGDIYHRLRSYSATTWFGKPPQLSSRECAGKGWTNTGPDQLTCLSCGSQILCKLPTNPYSEAAAGIVGKYTQRLVGAHSANCRQRSLLSLDQPAQPRSGGIGFPVIDPQRLSTAYRSRLQELQQIQSLPSVRSYTTGQLAAVAACLDPSILSGLAALLHMPEDSLRHEAAAIVTASSTAATSGDSSTYLPREQAQVLIALCGWQPKQLLPPHLAPAAAANASSTVIGIAHLLPRRGASSAGQPASTAGHTISPACTALECELCGSQVGLWKFSCSGPFYAQQLSSKAMHALTVAIAAAVPGPSTAAGTPTAANGVIGSPAQVGTDQAAQATAAVEEDNSRAQRLKRVHSESAAGGSLSPKAQQQQQQQQGGVQTSASPEAVLSTLTHTIAGGSLLTAAGVERCNLYDVYAHNSLAYLHCQPRGS